MADSSPGPFTGISQTTISPPLLGATVIESWIQACRWAPSGGNLQPWSVQVVDRTKTQVILNVKMREELKTLKSASDPWFFGGLTGIGCYVQNLIELSPQIHLTYTSHRTLLSAEFKDTMIQITFQGNLQTDTLATPTEAMMQRNTYRGPMATEPLPLNLVTEIAQMASQLQIKAIRLTQLKSKLIPIYQDLAYIRMRNSPLYRELMEELYDSKQQPDRQTGLPFKTLGLPPLTLIALRTIQSLGLHLKSRWANELSIRDSIHKPLTHSGDIFYLSAEDLSAESWLHLGLCYQQISLLLTKMRFATQPIAYGWILTNHFYRPSQSLHPKTEQDLIDQLERQCLKDLGIDLKKPGLLMRVGFPLQKPEPSPRRPVQFDWLSQKNTTD